MYLTHFLFALILFSLPLLTGCGGPVEQKEPSSPETQYYDPNHDLVKKGAALSARIRTLANNMPTKESLEGMMCKTMPHEAFYIEGIGLKVYTFSPDFLAQFADDPSSKYLGEELDEVTKTWKTNSSANWILDELPKLNHFHRWDSVIYTGPDPKFPDRETGINYMYLGDLSRVEDELILDGNFALVYKKAMVQTSADHSDSFNGGLAAATIVIYDKALEPLCAFDVAVVNDAQVAYEYRKGESQQEALARTAQANLQANFLHALKKGIEERIKGTPNDDTPYTSKIHVAVY